jgi:hypothetical protein
MSKSILYTVEKIIDGLQELKINDLTNIEAHNKRVDYWAEELRNYVTSYGKCADIISRAAALLGKEKS